MECSRELWIDRVKVIACVLVALGHFCQSMITAELVSAHSIYTGFLQTIYYFHVPLFFVCSGYLYQKTAKASLCAWGTNVVKKAIALGIPYFVFSFATWALKYVFSGSVNTQSGDLLKALFVAPLSPYWYLYTLFWIFVFTPAFRNSRMAMVGLSVALILKGISIFCGASISIYGISTVCANGIWFVGGMVLCQKNVLHTGLRKYCGKAGGICGLLFLGGSVSMVVFSVEQKEILSFGMGILGCAAVLLTSWTLERKTLWIDRLTQYTMPVFLMHTICAAATRAVLLKLGISNLALHVALGIVASFIGPCIAYLIMKKLKLDVVIYPARYIHFPQGNGERKHG